MINPLYEPVDSRNWRAPVTGHDLILRTQPDGSGIIAATFQQPAEDEPNFVRLVRHGIMRNHVIAVQ